MTAIEITESNINGYGYDIGGHTEKGTEILSRPKYIWSSWYSDDEDRIKKAGFIQELIDKYGEDRLFVKEIRMMYEDGSKSFNFEGMHEAAQAKFPVSKIVESNLDLIDSISIYTIPRVVTHMDIDKYSSSKDDQLELMTALLWETEQIDVGEGFVDSYYDISDDIMSFSSLSNRHDNWEYNGDYTLFHGGSSCYSDSVVSSIDGRMSPYNDAAVNDFWDFTMSDEDPFEHIDPEGKVSVYARKGKEWYVSSSVSESQIYLTYYHDYDGLQEEEEFIFYYDEATEELVNKVESYVHALVLDCQIKCIINDELHIGGYDNAYDYTNNIFNLKILDREYDDDLWSAAYSIMDFVDWENKTKEETMVMDAYEDFLIHNTDENGKLFGKYDHLNMFRDIVSKEGKKLVRTKVPNENRERWAIKYKNHEYHFELAELYETSPKAFYEQCSLNLTKRTLENIDKNALMVEAKNVFVGFEDSLEAGNCKTGTQSFCNRFGIDTSVIGGVRGDALLAMDYSNFTRRAVAQAISKRGKPHEEVNRDDTKSSPGMMSRVIEFVQNLIDLLFNNNKGVIA